MRGTVFYVRTSQGYTTVETFSGLTLVNGVPLEAGNRATIGPGGSFIIALSQNKLVATATTGRLIKEQTGLEVETFMSGPLGGDQQIGALVATEQIDLIIFLRDPLTAQPHEPDITALIRICDVHNIPAATNIKSANILIDYITHNKE